MKKLALLFSLSVLTATGLMAQTTPSADQCGTATNTLGSANSTFTAPNSFTITIPGPATGTVLTFDANLANTDNDQGITGLVVKEYLGGDEISCNGLTDGEIKAYISGGTGPYDYYLYSGATVDATPTAGEAVASAMDVAAQTNTFSNVAPGSYHVVVVDANGCSINTMTVPTFTGGSVTPVVGVTTLEQPDALHVTYCQTPDLCLSSNGVITLQISGGAQPYALGWTPGAFTGSSGSSGATPTAQAGTMAATPGPQSGSSSTANVGIQTATTTTFDDNTAASSDYATETENTQVNQTATISGITGSYTYNLSLNDANGCVVVP